jgi:pyruvate formate lyase activating enzyme
MSQEMLEMFHPYLDAANADLKAFCKETYHRYVEIGLQPILDNMKLMKRLGIWLDVTTLIIPDLNDNTAELCEAARFVAQELGLNTPWHISRFFPAYKMTEIPPTPLATLQQAWQIGLEEGLHYIYVVNIPDDRGQDTFCPECGGLLIRRRGYWIAENKIRKGCCPNCGRSIAGVYTEGSA